LLDIRQETRRILDRALGLEGRALGFADDTRLLGVLPELDSMAVVGVLTSLEERFGVVIGDDEIDGAAFATLGSLIDFVERKVSG
jgi:acyl carrier protein